jgi:hypothetical protein
MTPSDSLSLTSSTSTCSITSNLCIPSYCVFGTRRSGTSCHHTKGTGALARQPTAVECRPRKAGAWPFHGGGALEATSAHIRAVHIAGREEFGSTGGSGSGLVGAESLLSDVPRCDRGVLFGSGSGDPGDRGVLFGSAASGPLPGERGVLLGLAAAAALASCSRATITACGGGWSALGTGTLSSVNMSTTLPRSHVL